MQHPPNTDYRGLVRAGWILIIMVCVISVIPILGFAAWIIVGPIVLTSVILGVVAITRGGTIPGVVLLCCAMIGVPIFVILAPIVTSAIGITAVAPNQPSPQQSPFSTRMP